MNVISICVTFLCYHVYYYGALALDFNVTFLHTNDVHSRIEQTSDAFGGTCTTEMAAVDTCVGGIARRAAMVKEIRDGTDSVMLLDAGDQFQGTMWYYVYRGLASSHFMNMLQYDAMSLGNHEFDDGITGLLHFLDNVTFPILSCNMNADDEGAIQGKVDKSAILMVDGTRVGIVGYTLLTTPEFSDTGKLTFEDEVQAVQKEVDRLLASDVNIIVALGHSGIDVDLDIANQVEGVDIVIGGHTNTFLYTGSPPSSEIPYGVYPIVVHPDYNTSRTVLVVSAYAYGKYLGRLDVTFSEAGDVKTYKGNPILPDHSVAPDPTITSQVEDWGVKVNEVSAQLIGQTFVTLEADACGVRECNYGNLIADAMVAGFLQTPDEQAWSNASIAITTAGSIKSTIKPGEITVGNIRSTFPYGNTIDVIELKGEHLLQALEYSISDHDGQTRSNDFLQVAGLRVLYDVTRPAGGGRVMDVQVRCSRCTEPSYEKIDEATLYNIVTNSYIAAGGSGYSMVRDNKLSQIKGPLDMDTIIDYIGAKSPITTGLESRITILSESTNPPCNGGVTSLSDIMTWVVLVCLSYNLFVY